MKVLGARCDKLVLAYRVRLDKAFTAALAARATIAREHGRAAFEWIVRAPDDQGDGTVSSRRRVGPLRLRWADEVDEVEHVSKLWGELRYSRAQKTWFLTNEPYWQLRVDPHGPGGEDESEDCDVCRGWGMLGKGGKDGPCPKCDGRGKLDIPGWTLEITWYAQTLADWGLERVIAESHALASNTGEVLATRLRRIDLCADIEGWTFGLQDVECLAKRAQARWTYDDDGEPTEGDLEVHARAGDGPRSKRKRSSKQRADDGAQMWGKGAGATRRVTGISVGRGGALMCRIYDKRVELERHETHRDLEEQRWEENGWDGEAPVTRVEFQIRGVALEELGLRDPDACVEPVTKQDEYLDARGKVRVRTVVVGHRVLSANENGREVQATIVHRLDDIWRCCIGWVRLVVPETTREGNPKPNTRCKDDPRWALLREVRFTDQEPRPLRRTRKRGTATAAQALGVAISQAARDGLLEKMLPEDREAYSDDDEGVEVLRERIRALQDIELANIIEWLLAKWGGPAGASKHFAIRVNAAIARYARGFEGMKKPKPRPEGVRAVA